ncbi:hypothetical protein BSLG_000242 [Batrachochytrium salamandrivorans]|nr:hypothetical protein BSLG_000242 [Batrachochytrium salamandrivorans]
MRLTAVVWSFAPGDTDGRTDVAERMAARANSAVRNGTISLMHDFSLPMPFKHLVPLMPSARLGSISKLWPHVSESSALYPTSPSGKN